MRITWAERNCCADHQQNVEGCVETDIKELGWCLDDIFIGHKNLSVIALIRTSLQQNGWFSWALECFLEAVADLVCVALSGDTPPPKKVHHAFGWRLLPLPQNTPCIMIVTTNHYFFTLWCYFGQWGGGGFVEMTMERGPVHGKNIDGQSHSFWPLRFQPCGLNR